MFGINSGYVIAALPRTGSFRLCELLSQSGRGGYPQEYGAAEDKATWSSHHGFRTHIEYFYEFFRFCSTPNGVFGCKLMWPQFAALRRDIGSYLGIEGRGLAPIIAVTRSASLVFLQRQDRLMQAISLCRALQTGVWSSAAPAVDRPACYDRDGIASALEAIEANRLLWERFFARHDLDPYRLWYEDVAQGKVAEAVRHLGLPPLEQASRPALLRRQADSESTLWRDRFLEQNPERLATLLCRPEAQSELASGSQSGQSGSIKDSDRLQSFLDAGL